MSAIYFVKLGAMYWTKDGWTHSQKDAARLRRRAAQSVAVVEEGSRLVVMRPRAPSRGHDFATALSNSKAATQ